MISLFNIAQVLLVAVVLAFLLSFIPRRQPKQAPIEGNAPVAREQVSEQPTTGPSQPNKQRNKRKTSGPMTADLPSDIDPNAVKQLYDAFLVLDVEATCQPGTDFNYANEIIASCSHSLLRKVLTHTALLSLSV